MTQGIKSHDTFVSHESDGTRFNVLVNLPCLVEVKVYVHSTSSNERLA